MRRPEKSVEGEYLRAGEIERAEPQPDEPEHDLPPLPWTTRFLPLPHQVTLTNYLRLRGQLGRGDHGGRPDAPWPGGGWGRRDELIVAAHTLLLEAPAKTIGMVLATVWLTADEVIDHGHITFFVVAWALSHIIPGGLR